MICFKINFSLLVYRAGCGIWLYQFLIIAYLFTLFKVNHWSRIQNKENEILIKEFCLYNDSECQISDIIFKNEL